MRKELIEKTKAKRTATERVVSKKGDETMMEKVLVLVGSEELIGPVEHDAAGYHVRIFDKITDVNGQFRKNKDSIESLIAVLNIDPADGNSAWKLWICQRRLPGVKVIIRMCPFDEGKALMLIELGAFDVFSSLTELGPILLRAIYSLD